MNKLGSPPSVPPTLESNPEEKPLSRPVLGTGTHSEQTVGIASSLVELCLLLPDGAESRIQLATVEVVLG